MLTMFGGRVSTCEMQKQSNAMQVTYARKWAAMEYQSRYNNNGGIKFVIRKMWYGEGRSEKR